MVREIDMQKERDRNPWRTISPRVLKKSGLVAKKTKPVRPAGPPRREARQAQRTSLRRPKKPVGDDYLRDFFRNRTIAVVGNSFDSADIAQEVDQHDLVVRFNLDPARLKYGYTQVRPQVPAGDKTDIMAAFWNRMSVPGILKDFPEIRLLVSLRPAKGRMQANYIRSGLYTVDTPAYTISEKRYHNIAAKVQVPALCGIVFMYLLLQVNTAKTVNLYNFNFYVPSLNAGAKDVKTVYARYLFGHKGARFYGDTRKQKGHNLTASYKWLSDVVTKTPNITWRRTGEAKKEMDQFLL